MYCSSELSTAALRQGVNCRVEGICCGWNVRTVRRWVMDEAARRQKISSPLEMDGR